MLYMCRYIVHTWKVKNKLQNLLQNYNKPDDTLAICLKFCLLLYYFIIFFNNIIVLIF